MAMQNFENFLACFIFHVMLLSLSEVSAKRALSKLKLVEESPKNQFYK
jgi:hypothetical protein